MSKVGRKVKIFSALEVANICGVVNQTAINWIKSGYLKAFTTPGGQYRVYAGDLTAFLDKRGMSGSGEALQGFLEQANWSALLIAAGEPLNNCLYNEFGRLLPDFSLAQAFDGFELGLRFAADKPGFLLLDSDFQGVQLNKLFETLKNDPWYGNPAIFVIESPRGLLCSDESSENTQAGRAAGLVDRVFRKPPDAEVLCRAVREFKKQGEAGA